MIAILSPAKRLNEEPIQPLPHSFPALLDQAEELAVVLQKKSSRQLQNLMDISKDLSDLNVERYQAMEFPPQPGREKQAVLTFQGDVYQGLQAADFSENDLEFAQRHMRILSGLYGLLRPLDLIHPYRLEMGTPLEVKRAKSLYQFWDNQITDELNQALSESGSSVLINLASKEYFQAVQPERVQGHILHIHFKEERDGELKVISFFAKKARGLMARFMVLNRITDPDALKEFDMEDYQFNEAESDRDNWLFTR